ncbi:MAG: hypothetical protein Q7K37_12775 [Dehalococcoidia bacterium]|nr:hypothetical protein [Dehalococcoidia bacterium]
MLPRWLRGDTDTDPDAGRSAANESAVELAEIVGTLLAQTVTLESMIQRGDDSEESQGRRDTIVDALERTRARLADAQQVLSEGQGRSAG